MSNPVSLFVEEQSFCLAELADEDVMGCERNPNMKDYLDGAHSDLYTFELSQLFEARRDAFKYQPTERILRIILWAWVDKKDQICDIDSDLADQLGLDTAISPISIQKLGSEINGFNPASVAKTLYAPNEVWPSAVDLAEYLGRWKEAFSDALNHQKGLYYKIWV